MKRLDVVSARDFLLVFEAALDEEYPHTGGKKFRRGYDAAFDVFDTLVEQGEQEWSEDVDQYVTRLRAEAGK